MAIRGIPEKEQNRLKEEEKRKEMRMLFSEINTFFSIEDEPQTGYVWRDKNGQPTSYPRMLPEKMKTELKRPGPLSRKIEENQTPVGPQAMDIETQKRILQGLKKDRFAHTVQKVIIERKRMPIDDNDFQLVFDRDMKKRNLPKKEYIEAMIQILEELKEGHRDTWHSENITLIANYLEFLNKYQDESILTYERLLKDPQECKRITGIIENQCENGIFKGFKEAATVKPGTQLRIIYDLLTVDKLKNMVTMKGSINEARRVFFARFGLNAIRGREIEETDINIQAAYKPSKPNTEAKQELSLIFLNR